MSFWKRIRQESRPEAEAEAETNPAGEPSATPPGAHVQVDLGFERVRLTQALRSIEVEIEFLEQSLAALAARERHRDDDLGPLALAREGAPGDRVEVSWTLAGPRHQLQALDVLLRHLCHATQIGRRQIHALCVDAGGAAAIQATRDGVELSLDDDEERWVYDEDAERVRGRRVAYGREPLDLFLD